MVILKKFLSSCRISKMDAAALLLILVFFGATLARSKINVDVDQEHLRVAQGVLIAVNDQGSVRGHFRDTFELGHVSVPKFVVPATQANADILKRNVGKKVVVKYQNFYDSGIFSIRKNLARVVITDNGQKLVYRMPPHDKNRMSHFVDFLLYVLTCSFGYLAVRSIVSDRSKAPLA